MSFLCIGLSGSLLCLFFDLIYLKNVNKLNPASLFTIFLEVNLFRSTNDFYSYCEKSLELYKVTIVIDTIKVPARHAITEAVLPNYVTA